MLAETTSEKKPFLPDCLPQNRHDGTRPPLPIPRRPLTPSRHAVLTPQNASRHAPALPSALSRHFLPRCPPRGAGGEIIPPDGAWDSPPSFPSAPFLSLQNSGPCRAFPALRRGLDSAPSFPSVPGHAPDGGGIGALAISAFIIYTLPFQRVIQQPSGRPSIRADPLPIRGRRQARRRSVGYPERIQHFR